MDWDFIAWFDLSRSSKIGCKWPFFFQEWRIFSGSQYQRSRSIPPLLSGLSGWRARAWQKCISFLGFVTQISCFVTLSLFEKSFLIGWFEIAAALSCSSHAVECSSHCREPPRATVSLCKMTTNFFWLLKWKKSGPCRWLHEKIGQHLPRNF